MPASPPGALPTFLIVGAMKAGTTSLAALLKRHPDVGMARVKEVHYFDARTPRPDWYASQFAAVADRAARFEATPTYLYRHAVPDRIARELPDDVRFVAVLRDPVDRAYSHYWHGRRMGALDMSFEEALRLEPAEIARGFRTWWSLMDRGRYLPQLRRYEALFGRERLLVLLMDDLLRDPAGTADRVAEFVGVAPLGARWGSLPHAHRARRAVVPHSVLTFAGRMAVKARWLPRRLRRRYDLLLSLPFTPPPMDPETRARLGRSMRADNEALAEWLGRDLSHWAGMEPRALSPGIRGEP